MQKKKAVIGQAAPGNLHEIPVIFIAHMFQYAHGDDTQANSAAKAISEAAFKFNQLRENWLNPCKWVDWIITPEEEKADYPKRSVAKSAMRPT